MNLYGKFLGLYWVITLMLLFSLSGTAMDSKESTKKKERGFEFPENCQQLKKIKHELPIAVDSETESETEAEIVPGFGADNKKMSIGNLLTPEGKDYLFIFKPADEVKKEPMWPIVNVSKLTGKIEKDKSVITVKCQFFTKKIREEISNPIICKFCGKEIKDIAYINRHVTKQHWQNLNN